MSTTSTIRLEQFDGKKESWPTFKTRAIAFFMANEQAYDLLFSDNMDAPVSQATTSSAPETSRVKRETKGEEDLSTPQTTLTSPRRFSAAERYVYSTIVGAVKHADDLKYFDGVKLTRRWQGSLDCLDKCF